MNLNISTKISDDLNPASYDESLHLIRLHVMFYGMCSLYMMRSMEQCSMECVPCT